MRQSFAKALLGFFALSQALCLTQAFPYKPTEAISAQHDYEGHGSNVLSPLDKRAPPDTKDLSSFTFFILPFDCRYENKLQTTYYGTLDEPKNSGWDEDFIDKMVEYVYDRKIPNAAFMLAALWVPSVGVYFGTVPRGRVEIQGQRGEMREELYEDMTTWFRRSAPENAPIMWESVKGREVKEKGASIWHAEDMAMYGYESSENAQDYKGTYLSVFGKYNSADTAGFKKPCGSSGSGKIEPGCFQVLKDLEIGNKFIPKKTQ